jgi:mannitol/fructose-specific phosphotransferase system IIA component (Ntr-type)
MDLNDFLGPNPIIVELKARDRWEAIDELMRSLVASNRIKPEDEAPITMAVKQRESSMTTGIGSGFGLPHAETNLIYEVVSAVGRSRRGIQFDAIDGKPVNLVFLFLVPEGEFQKHLHTLANMAKLLHSSSFRDDLGLGS